MEYKEDKAHYVAVTAIIVKDGKYLIAKRAEWEDDFPNEWTVPGGKLEAKDYQSRKKDTSQHWYNVLEAVVKREVMEEVGLEIDNIGYVTSLVYIRKDGIPCMIVSLFASPKEGEIKLCDALTEYKWVSLEEAKNYKLIEGIYEELEILDNYLKSGKNMFWRRDPER